MNPTFSIYLEIARVIATLIVFLAHGSIFYQHLYEQNEVLRLGRDGVIIFFVLSGFVITWCANERDKSLTDFAINRASRIYSVAIPGIILGAVSAIYVSFFSIRRLLIHFTNHGYIYHYTCLLLATFGIYRKHHQTTFHTGH